MVPWVVLYWISIKKKPALFVQAFVVRLQGTLHYLGGFKLAKANVTFIRL
jgi:hypothetical protein